MLKIHFTATAWRKQQALIDSFTTEVGWHGLVRLIDGGFEIYDIIVYPQTVTNSTVVVDQGEYSQWYFEHPDFDFIHYHAHSHVDMDPYPSTTDLKSEADRHIPDNQFYIFMIWNRDYFYTARIYDHGRILDQNEIELTCDSLDRDFLIKALQAIRTEGAHRQ